MAIFGMLLIFFYAVTITEGRLARYKHLHSGDAQEARKCFQSKGRELLAKLIKALFGVRTLVFTYVASGLQLFTAYAIIAWMPSYLNRYHGLPPGKSALSAAGLLIVSGIGMALCGYFTDRVGRNAPERKPTLAIIYCLVSCVVLMIGFRLPPSTAQFAVIAAGVFLAAGTFGAAGAMVANLVDVAIHSTALATLTLANNLLGGAPGPYLTGVLADHIGLQGALQLIPLVSLAAALAFALAKANYGRDLRHFQTAPPQTF
jgi:MFS family permease